MARKKNNELKLTEIKKQAKSLDQMETTQLEGDKDLHFYPVFKETIIQELLEELQQNFIYANENNIELKESMIYSYTLFLCIKYFTHLKKDIPDTFEEQVEAMQWLVDTGYFKEIVEEVFDKKELNKIWDKITDFLATVQFSDKLASDVQKKFANLQLENREIIENAFASTKAKFENVLASGDNNVQ